MKYNICTQIIVVKNEEFLFKSTVTILKQSYYYEMRYLKRYYQNIIRHSPITRVIHYHRKCIHIYI